MPPAFENGRCPMCEGKEPMSKEAVAAVKKELATMSESEKTELEIRDCQYFLDAYEFATDQEFDATIEKSESPDFICTRRNGTTFGIELTRLIRSPSAEFGFKNYETVDRSGESTVEGILRLAGKKGNQIQKPGMWKTKENILVFQLYNLGLSELTPFLEAYREAITETLSALTIDEVWIADFVGEHGDNLEAHDAVNLFALSPDENWGLYANPNTGGKPFG